MWDSTDVGIMSGPYMFGNLVVQISVKDNLPGLQVSQEKKNIKLNIVLNKFAMIVLIETRELCNNFTDVGNIW